MGTLRPLGAVFWWREERRTRDAERRRRQGAIDARGRLSDLGQLVMGGLGSVAGLTAADLAPRTRSRNWCDDSKVCGSGTDRNFSRTSHSIRPVRRAIHRRAAGNRCEERVERRTPQAPYRDQHGGCPGEAQEG